MASEFSHEQSCVPSSFPVSVRVVNGLGAGDIDIRTEHPEFSDWRWSRFDQLADLIVPFKRDLYRAIVTEFTPIASDLAIAAATRKTP